MVIKGTIGFYSRVNVLLYEKHYHGKTDRTNIINYFLSGVLGKRTGCYYQIYPYVIVKTDRLEKVVPDLPTEMIRPPAIYDNTNRSLYPK